MPRKLFIIIPSLDESAPVKGSLALIHALIKKKHPCKLIVLKKIKSEKKSFLDQIECFSWPEKTGYLKKMRDLKRLIKKEKVKPVCLSFCFSADVMNFFLRDMAYAMTSIRGDLLVNYQFSYNRMIGIFFANFHYFLLKFFNKVTVVSQHLFNTLKSKYKSNQIEFWGNFVDEIELENSRKFNLHPKQRFQFLCLGRLVQFKRFDLAIRAVKALHNQGLECDLKIRGDGPEFNRLKDLIDELGLKDSVELKGYVSQPFELIQEADCFVHPSETEGISRSVLEALFYDVPCVVRKIQVNEEIIQEGKNGFLFEQDDDLVVKMREACFNKIKTQECLIPNQFRQDFNTEKFIHMIENLA